MGSELQRQESAIPGLIVRPGVGSDVQAIAPRLRTADLAEVVAHSGLSAVDALGQGFLASERCMTVEFNGRPSAMFGIVPSGITGFPRLGHVWLLGTDDIHLFSRQFLRQSVPWLKEICTGYDIVGNVVDARNAEHVRWLEWLGFRFVKKHDRLGHLGLPFLEFVKIVTEIPIVLP